MTLREVLHAHIPTLDRHSTLRDAVDKMDVYQFPALVLLNEHQTPTGVITEGDVVRAAQGRGSVVSLADEPAHLYATADPFTAHPDQEISDALHAMLSRGITLLPVVQETVLLGVVLRIDLMQALLMDAGTPSDSDPDSDSP